jgi:hypothetical protein
MDYGASRIMLSSVCVTTPSSFSASVSGRHLWQTWFTLTMNVVQRRPNTRYIQTPQGACIVTFVYITSQNTVFSIQLFMLQSFPYGCLCFHKQFSTRLKGPVTNRRRREWKNVWWLKLEIFIAIILQKGRTSRETGLWVSLSVKSSRFERRVWRIIFWNLQHSVKPVTVSLSLWNDYSITVYASGASNWWRFLSPSPGHRNYPKTFKIVETLHDHSLESSWGALVMVPLFFHFNHFLGKNTFSESF